MPINSFNDPKIFQTQTIFGTIHYSLHLQLHQHSGHSAYFQKKKYFKETVSGLFVKFANGSKWIFLKILD